MKLTEVLKEVLPTFPDLIADMGRVGLNIAQSSAREEEPPAISAALVQFIGSVEASSGSELAAEDIAVVYQLAREFAQQDPNTLVGQNEAFRQVILRLQELGCSKTGDEWMELNAGHVIPQDWVCLPLRTDQQLR